ncbi:hypothetical protein ACIBG8_37405 [Nonomuraea sp. NPDC050556]|uniref:hypothetical protein n=1 Tax=Nonomuraea sp. NPDC050556 TaxID=3364369 RepID=UPI0037920C93
MARTSQVVVGVLLAVPTVVNVAGGLRWVLTPSLPAPLLDALARAGLLDAWLLLDLLTALGVVAALFFVRRLPLAAVSLTCLAAALTGPPTLPLWYGVAYAVAYASASWTCVSTAGR